MPDGDDTPAMLPQIKNTNEDIHTLKLKNN